MLNANVQEALEKDLIIDITTTGRKSGDAHRVEIWFHNLDGILYITGPPRHPRLVRQHPRRPPHDLPPQRNSRRRPPRPRHPHHRPRRKAQSHSCHLLQTGHPGPTR